VSTGTGFIVDSKGTCRTHVLTEEKLYKITASRWRGDIQENFPATCTAGEFVYVIATNFNRTPAFLSV